MQIKQADQYKFLSLFSYLCIFKNKNHILQLAIGQFSTSNTLINNLIN